MPALILHKQRNLALYPEECHQENSIIDFGENEGTVCRLNWLVIRMGPINF